MADKKVLVTSGGVYAFDKDGKTLPLEKGTEASIEAEQADKLVKQGRVGLVLNSGKSKQDK